MTSLPLLAVAARRSPDAAHRRFAALALLAATACLGGCDTMKSVTSAIPTFGLFEDTKKLGPLPEIRQEAIVQPAWRVTVGKAGMGFSPSVAGEFVNAAAPDGTLLRIDGRNGRLLWKVETGKPLSGGVGASPTLVVVGTEKGEVLAYTPDGKAAWQARVSSELLGPPVVGESTVAVWTGDGRIYGLAAADGKTRWVHQRTIPPLIVRTSGGGVLHREALFTGTPGGKLVALDMLTGNVGWEGNVATPKGATELERIADITSLPAADERLACAVAYQGRLACFDPIRGGLEWSREISSLVGLARDEDRLYVTDDRGSVHALDRSTGASIWRQDKLAARRPGGPQVMGDYVGVVDGEGILHIMDAFDGTLVDRIATDGSPSTAQPVRFGDGILWQSQAGYVYLMIAR